MDISQKALHAELFEVAFSRAQLFVTLWSVVCRSPLFMGFSSLEYWSGLPSLSPEDLPDPRIKPECPALQADFLLPKPPGKHMYLYIIILI